MTDPNAPLVCDVCEQVIPQLDGGQRTADAVVCEPCARRLRERADRLRQLDAAAARIGRDDEPNDYPPGFPSVVDLGVPG